jgi:hypothetical protein
MFEEKGDIHIFDMTKGGELVTVMKPSCSIIRYSALESINGQSLVTASSDCLVNFYTPDPHSKTAMRLSQQFFSYNTSVLTHILYVPKI